MFLYTHTKCQALKTSQLLRKMIIILQMKATSNQTYPDFMLFLPRMVRNGIYHCVTVKKNIL